MLNPSAICFRDAWEDGIGPRWKDAPDDLGFGSDHTRFRVGERGTFLGQAGLLDVYVVPNGRSEDGIQFVEQAPDGFLIGQCWINLRYIEEQGGGKLDMGDPAAAAALFWNELRKYGPKRPDPVPQEVLALRLYRRLLESHRPTAPAPKGTVVRGMTMFAGPMDETKASFALASPSVRHRYPVHIGDRSLLFVGTCGVIDVWSHIGAPGGQVCLVAVSPDSSETECHHDTIRDGSCVRSDEHRWWAQPVVEWLMKPKDGLPPGYQIGVEIKREEDCKRGNHVWSNGPVAREENRVCKWCGKSKATVGLKDTRAKSSVTDDDLVAALRESEWWKKAVKFYAGYGLNGEKTTTLLVARDRNKADDLFEPAVRTLRSELLAIVDEIESGRIYGSRERCAVCGFGDERGAVYRIDPVDHAASHFAHQACRMTDRPPGLSIPAAVLSARRLRAEKRAEVPTNYADRMIDRSGHGNDLTVKPGNPLPCAGCGKPSTRHLNHLLVCAGCGDLLLATRGGGKPEVLARLALEHADTMAAELRDPHKRHGLVEQALSVYNGMAFVAGLPEAVSGKAADEMVEVNVRANEACRRLAAMLRREADAEQRAKVGGLRTEAECRAVRERFIAGNVPAWLDPRSK